MRQHNRRESLRDTKTHEQQEKRDTRNNICIHHRDRIRKVHHLAGPRPQVENTDSSNTAQQRGDGRRNHRNGERIP